MGIYDRDYYRQEPQYGSSRYVPHSIVGIIIAVNVAVWLIDGFFMPKTDGGGSWLSDAMAVHVGTLTRPWLWWQFLTAGFAHDSRVVSHILMNMLTLYFLGRDVEMVYGRKEFLRLYLVMVVFASVVWSAVNYFTGPPQIIIDKVGIDLASQFWNENVRAMGASGAIAGVVALYALNFPNRTLLLWFVIPIPAWVLGVMVVGYDMFGASGRGGAQNVAYSMHLAGAAFALVYFLRGWRFSNLTEGRFSFSLPGFQRKPKLRIHEPREEEPKTDDLSIEVDRILEKIYRTGEASLTDKERKTLVAASREFQRRSGN